MPLQRHRLTATLIHGRQQSGWTTDQPVAQSSPSVSADYRRRSSAQSVLLPHFCSFPQRDWSAWHHLGSVEWSLSFARRWCRHLLLLPRRSCPPRRSQWHQTADDRRMTSSRSVPMTTDLRQRLHIKPRRLCNCTTNSFDDLWTFSLWLGRSSYSYEKFTLQRHDGKWVLYNLIRSYSVGAYYMINVAAVRSGNTMSINAELRYVFTALHGMQARSSDEISVCPSVCHTRGLWQNGRKICPDLYTIWKNI